jgi:hypothetical protein
MGSIVKRLLIIVMLTSGLWAAGCGDEDNPSPQFNYGVMAGGRMLLPTVVPKQADTSILGAAVSPEEAGAVKAVPAGETAANVIRIQVDDSTAEGVVTGYVAILDSGNLAQLPDILVPEQQETAREVVAAVGPVMQAFKALEAKWKEKFPDTPLQGMQAGVPGMSVMQSAKMTGVEAQGDTEAEATIEVPGASEPVKLKVRKVENVWRVQDPGVPPPEQAAKLKEFFGAFGEFAKGIQEVIQRLDNNELATAQDAQEALGQAMQKALGPLMGAMTEAMKNQMEGAAKPSEPAGEAPAENAKPAPKTSQPAPPPQPRPADNTRPKSELEQDVDNAAGRAALGGGI